MGFPSKTCWRKKERNNWINVQRIKINRKYLTLRTYSSRLLWGRLHTFDVPLIWIELNQGWFAQASHHIWYIFKGSPTVYDYHEDLAVKPWIPRYLCFLQLLQNSPAAPAFCQLYHQSYRSSANWTPQRHLFWQKWRTWPCKEHISIPCIAVWPTQPFQELDGNLLTKI